jgi:hypothetical protein
MLPSLPLGDRTRSVLENKIREGLLGPDGIFVNMEGSAQFGWEGLPEPKDNMAIGQPIIEAHRQWLEQAALAAKVFLGAGQLEDLAHKWVVWHELGHAIQASYHEAASHDGRSAFLSLDALQAGHAPLTVEHPKSEPQRLANFRRISEGFPEGLAQMLVEQYVESEFSLDHDQAVLLHLRLTPPHRRESAEDAMRFLTSEGICIADASKVFMDGAYEAGDEVGYGSPLSSEQVRLILEHTP